jgi:hypothetical protein
MLNKFLLKRKKKKMTDEIRAKLPQYYSEEEKDKVIILLTNLANIYIDTLEES